jgi:hypothetical protein
MGQLLVGDDLSSFSTRDKNMFLKSGSLFSAYKDTTPNFPDYKTFMHTIIDGLNSATRLQHQNEQLRYANTGLAEYHGILTNIAKLKEYIDAHYTNFSITLFEAEQTIDVPFIIKPEYIVYFERHGIPGDEGFDSEKLSLILIELNG